MTMLYLRKGIFANSCGELSPDVINVFSWGIWNSPGCYCLGSVKFSSITSRCSEKRAHGEECGPVSGERQNWSFFTRSSPSWRGKVTLAAEIAKRKGKCEPRNKFTLTRSDISARTAVVPCINKKIGLFGDDKFCPSVELVGDGCILPANNTLWPRQSIAVIP